MNQVLMLVAPLLLTACSNEETPLDRMEQLARQEASILTSSQQDCNRAVERHLEFMEANLSRLTRTLDEATRMRDSQDMIDSEASSDKMTRCEKLVDDALDKFSKRCSVQARDVAETREAMLKKLQWKVPGGYQWLRVIRRHVAEERQPEEL